MRKPRDYDAELKALDDKTRQLKSRRVVQLGELVIACDADTMPIEVLAGALLDAVASKDAAAKEAWRARGAVFFRGRPRTAAKGAAGNEAGTATSDNGTAPA